MVGPPLSCKGPSMGSTLSSSLALQPVLPWVLPIRLPFAERNWPETSGSRGAEFAPMMVNRTTAAPPLMFATPPP